MSTICTCTDLVVLPAVLAAVTVYLPWVAAVTASMSRWAAPESARPRLRPGSEAASARSLD